ncbi:serine-rich adhesin for platelets-like isoform X2 [Palaemon carinicauda]|uniref:serine-rich adhesin for platelets-like isoform X2 n=1 Tax=Palaemon carinicauda TaxID=392227 RepID=UPI0035B67EEF
MASSGEEKDDGQDDTVASDSEVVLDLCGRRLKRLEKAPANQAYATALVLDNNSLQNLANLDSYGELERLSIANNQVVRMYWFARMYSLRVLNLPNNSIVQIEGMRELAHLIHLNLAGNKIKTIEGLSNNKTLEHLNLSGNYISHINDLSMLKSLKELFLHRNRITTLYRCNKYLPPGLIILTLSDNQLADLNDLSNLSHLNHLEQVTILNNPCLDPLQPTDELGAPMGPLLAFDYRPYVINWCLNLKVLDGYKVSPKESLKAEWLYSQGKGRGFQVGEHAPLVQYLSGVCLAGGGWGGADLPDDDDKLAKILQLAKQHQHDLRHAVNGQDNSESSSGRGSRSSSHHDSPAMHRRSVSRSSSMRRNTAPSRSAPPRECHRRTHSHSAATRKECNVRGSQQAQSYHVELSSTLYGGDLRTPETPSLMTQSMDPAILSQLAGTSKRSSADPMSLSLGAEQMSRSLGMDMLSQSLGHEDLKHSMEFDPMTQSLGPEQLARSLGQPDINDLMTRSLDFGHLTNGEAETWGERISHPPPAHTQPRPTSLFGDENDLVVEDVTPQESNSQLSGSTKFVPAPESIMSPEFQATAAMRVSQGQAPQSQGSSQARSQLNATVTRSNSASRSQRPPPSQRPTTSTPQATPRQPQSRSSSATRPRASPMKSPAPNDIGRGSPSHSQRLTGGSSTNGPATLPKPKPSPKPAPRYVRSVSVEPSARRQATLKKGKAVSPHHGYSDADSDNTDSEMSVSKLQTIRSIAAERKTEKRGREPNQGSHAYDPEKYKCNSALRNSGGHRRSSNSSSGSSTSDLTKTQAVITLQKHWRGYQARNNDPKTAKIRDDIRHSRAEQHIKHLTEKLRSTEEALERERRLRHMQLDAIRTLWREIQKLQATKREDVTPSTPMTPLTPLTPLDAIKDNNGTVSVKKYSEESVKQLTEFCTSLQGQVGQLQDSLSLVTQVMNAFCNLPGSQSLLTMSQSSGSGQERSPGGADSPNSQCAGVVPVPLSESVSSLTHSIRALTTSIVKSPSSRVERRESEGDGCRSSSNSRDANTGSGDCTGSACGDDHCSDGSDGTPVACLKQSEHLEHLTTELASMASVASADLNSTALDASTLSVDSAEGGEADATGRDEAELSESSQSSLSGSLSGSHSGSQSGGSRQAAPQGPPRPSSLPVPRPHTPRSTTS